MSERKYAIDAVYDEELEQLLTSLEVIEDFRTGKMKCLFCETTVSHENLGSIFPYEGEVALSCNCVECAIKLLEVKIA